MPALCPKCGTPVPMPALDMGEIMSKAMEKIGPEKLASMDKMPAQIRTIENGLRLANAKLNAMARTVGIDYAKDPEVVEAKKRYV